ncbi:MAG: hypothetical protein ABIJ61_14445 [bacterium]
MKFSRLALFCALLLLAGSDTLCGAYTGRDFFHDLINPGRRQGLTGRFDLAGGLVHTKAEHPSWSKDYTSDDGGAGVVFGVGFGITDQFILSGTIRGLVYGEYAPLGVITGPLVLLFADEHMIASVNLSFYVNRHTPSLFFEAGVGGGMIGNPFDEGVINEDSEEGPGLIAGIGYEFNKHMQVEVHLLWSQNAKEDHASRGQWTVTTVMVTFGVLGY